MPKDECKLVEQHRAQLACIHVEEELHCSSRERANLRGCSRNHGEGNVCMRKLRLVVLVFVISLVALPGVATAKHTDTAATGKAQLHPLPLFNEEGGVVPGSSSGVRGTFTFVDDDNSITISGEAWGLDPAGTYVSLIYDNGSVPGGPFSCEPTGGDLEGMMLVGDLVAEMPPDIFWDVDVNGHGTIYATDFLNEAGLFGGEFTPESYVSLDEFDTISIRQLELDGAVVACGEVATHPAG